MRQWMIRCGDCGFETWICLVPQRASTLRHDCLRGEGYFHYVKRDDGSYRTVVVSVGQEEIPGWPDSLVQTVDYGPDRSP